jgi:hypothetical protein
MSGRGLPTRAGTAIVVACAAIVALCSAIVVLYTAIGVPTSPASPRASSRRTSY